MTLLARCSMHNNNPEWRSPAVAVPLSLVGGYCALSGHSINTAINLHNIYFRAYLTCTPAHTIWMTEQSETLIIRKKIQCPTLPDGLSKKCLITYISVFLGVYAFIYLFFTLFLLLFVYICGLLFLYIFIACNSIKQAWQTWLKWNACRAMTE